MKTIMVVSDSHGNRAMFDKLSDRFDECDYIFHLGDTSSDGSVISRRYPDKTHLFNGNCDGIAPLGQDEEVVKIEGVTIFACHGHKYGVKSNPEGLVARAKEVGAQIALYGHTHKALEKNVDGITILNPGTLQRYSRDSYAYIVVNGENFTCKIVDVTN